jgi:16S rRNA (guanine966-N2)-methyltransferase
VPFSGRPEGRHNAVRITGGRYKGQSIRVAAGKARYTSSKVRKAIFDRIGDLTGLKVLDLFAGSASFSIEALSRGAVWCTAIEKDGVMARMAADNVKKLGLDKGCLVLNMDVRYALPVLSKRGDVFDVIFMDPPYEKGYVDGTLDLLKKYRLHQTGGLIIIEHSKREIPPPPGDSACALESRKYGDTMVTLIDCNDTSCKGATS